MREKNDSSGINNGDKLDGGDDHTKILKIADGDCDTNLPFTLSLPGAVCPGVGSHPHKGERETLPGPRPPSPGYLRLG